ncbi:hypothetical protein DM02DRAFT_676624 [Periconia macrospinosa]|uniref:Uncharacterized protein n=1 Tax=Periconia macrospinosa TaxID=97972 RepID=A0A2V1D6T6_9PLEO|nr:hypothetical protein DM02DRAFT_676624 [Periconia macrospinosa]
MDLQDSEPDTSNNPNFDWLGRSGRGSAYISYNGFSHLSATSFDFGHEGHAASCNYGGEILQLSAPSSRYGLIFASGHFSPSLYASLARRQRANGGPATFSLKPPREKHDTPSCPKHRKDKHDPQFGSKHPADKHDRRSCSKLLKEKYNHHFRSTLPKEKHEQASRSETPKEKHEETPRSETPKKKHEQPSSLVRIDRILERGTFNYRWPFTEYSLVRSCRPEKDLKKNGSESFSGKNSSKDDAKSSSNCITDQSSQSSSGAVGVRLDQNMDPPPQHQRAAQNKEKDECKCYKITETQIGTCAIFSFVMKDVVYQVVRITSKSSQESEEPWPEPSEMDFTIGGPIWFYHHNPFNPTTDKFPMKPDEKALQEVQYAPSHGKEECLTVYHESKKIALQARVYQHIVNGSKESYKPILLEKQNGKTIHSVEPYSVPISLHQGKSITLVAAFRLVEGTHDSNLPWTHEMPSSPDVYHYIGGDGGNLRAATAQMWDTIIHQRHIRNNSLSQITDVHLLGRCFEKIVHVDTIQRDGTLALVSNLFMGPEISYSALFWKVRFMVKMYQFFRDIQPVEGPDPRPNDDAQSRFDAKNETKKMLNIAQNQIIIVKEKIREIMFFLIRQLESQSSSPTSTSNRVKAKPDYYYILITIWFCVKNLPDFDWKGALENDSRKGTKNGPKSDSTKDSTAVSESESIKAKLYQVNELEARNLGLGNDDNDFGMAKEEVIPLLQWYHYESILGLSERGFLNPHAWGVKPLRKRAFELRKAALEASAARVSSGRPYRASDEVVDRLEFLAHEMQLERDYYSPSVALLAKNRIKEREFTSNLNPGVRVPRADGAEDHTDGPWENLRTARKVWKEVEHYKKKLFQFLNSEATLTPCWERSYLGENKSWGESEATSILGSTLLDIDQTFRDFDNQGDLEKLKEFEEFGMDEFRDPDSPDAMEVAHTAVFKEITLTDSRPNQRIRIVEKGTPDAGPFQWRSWRPPRLYHPENFMISLDDTPQKYKKQEISKMVIPPALLEYVADPHEVHDFDKNSLVDLGSERDRIFLADLVETEIDFKDPSFQDSGSMLCAGQMIETDDPDVPIGDLVDRLFDSLVDLNVRHRFLVVASKDLERPEKENLRNVLVYVLCPWSAVFLTNHFLKLARFKCQSQNDWVARITVIGWRTCKKETKENKEKKEPRDDDEVISLPDHFELENYDGDDNESTSAEEVEKNGIHRSDTGNFRSRKDVKPNPKLLNKERFELRVSSFVLATNPFGDFSKCTIISEEIDGKELREIARKAQRVWRAFVHQPQTARCLVFLLVLGKLAIDMIEEYSYAAKILRSILGLDHLKQDVESWPDQSDAIQRFQHVIWSLESLYKLQRSLEQSLKSITEAKDEMLAQIKDGSIARGDSLEAICQEHIDSFESRYSRLCAEAIALDRVIELNARYKDASEAILNLTGNRTSLRQNRTIERLTYLTIMYLPMGLMAVSYICDTAGAAHRVSEYG